MSETAILEAPPADTPSVRTVLNRTAHYTPRVRRYQKQPEILTEHRRSQAGRDFTEFGEALIEDRAERRARVRRRELAPGVPRQAGMPDRFAKGSIALAMAWGGGIVVRHGQAEGDRS